MVFDIEQYIKDLEAANVPKELIDKMTTEVKPGFMRQDTFSRRQQQLDLEQRRLEALHGQLSEYETYVKSLEQAYGPRDQWSAAFARQVGQHNPDGSGAVTGLTPEQFDARLNAALQKQREELLGVFSQQLEQVGQGSAVFTKFYVDTHKRWEKEYSGEFPEADFQKFYAENGHTDPRVAVQLFEQPYKAAKEKAAWEQKIKDAEVAAEQRVRSQLGSPELGGSGTWAGGDTQMSIGAAAPTLPTPGSNTDDAKAAETAAAIRKSWAALNPSASGS